MSNNNNSNDIDAQDVYVDNPELGSSRQQAGDNTPESGSSRQQARTGASMSGSIRERTLQETAKGPISSGQQSSTSTDSSGNAGYSTPESGYGQPSAQGEVNQPESEYNQSSYSSPRTSDQSQGGPQMDGYSDTEGSRYGQNQGNPNLAQQGYNPAKSGVKPAKNIPGETIDTPGRETGTAWGEDQQMGNTTTDASDRRNPAG